MSDSGEGQELPNETTESPGKRKGRGRKRNPTKIVIQPKSGKKARPLATTDDKLPGQQLPPQTAPQLPQAVMQSSLPVLQHPQTVQLPSLTGLQPSQAVSQLLQTLPHPGNNSTPLPTFVQFTMPPNVFPSPMLNSTLQAPLQQAVPSPLAATSASTMNLLNYLNDDKLGIILPVLVRMEHKIDQLITMVEAKSSQGMGNHLNAATTCTEIQNNAGGQAITTLSAPQANTTPHLTPHLTSPQANTTGVKLSTSTMANIQANARLTVAQLFGTAAVENEDNTESEQSADKGFNPAIALPGMTSGQRIQLEMAKITEKTLPDDLDFPLSRDDLIALQAKSTSTMNFAVRLLREMFTREELLGRNLSGVRGKERVDPARVEIIKEIVFKIYRTSPSDRELLWRYCRKAMDSFLRKMQRPIEVVKDQYDPPSVQVTDTPVSEDFT